MKAMPLAAGSTTFYDVRLKSIRRSQVETWVKSMNTAGLAPGTAATRFNNVRAVFRAAHRDKLIASDPSDGITLPRKRRAEHAMRIPSHEDVGALLRASENRPFIGLCAFAALRLGEAAAIQLGDVDFLRRTLSVARQVQRANKGQVEI